MKILNYIKNNKLFASFFVLLYFFLVYGSVYFFIDGVLALDDHFYSIKLSVLLKDDLNFFFDHSQYLPNWNKRIGFSFFHIFLVVFASINDLFLALQISDVFLASSSFALIYYALRKFKIRYPFLLLLILFSSAEFSSRMFMGRGYVMTFGFLLLEIYFAQKKKHKHFFWISFLHILWHPTSSFLPFFAIFSVEISRYLTEKKVAWKNFFSACVAYVLGLAFFPNFPHNTYSSIGSVIKTSLASANGVKLQGSELYPRSSLQILNQDRIISFLAIFSVALVVYLFFKKRKTAFNAFEQERFVLVRSLFLLLLVFGFGTWILSGRFFDYYILVVPILFFIALELVFSQEIVEVKKDFAKLVLCVCFVFFFLLGVNNYLDLRKSVANSDYTTIKEPIEWIRDNSEDKEMVYLFNWSNFPQAFFYNDKNIYSWGMEPRNLGRKSPELYWKAYNIMAYRFYCEEKKDCSGEYDALMKKEQEVGAEEWAEIKKENSRKIIESIKNDFGARFVLSSDVNFSDTLRLNEDLIEDQKEAVSEKKKDYRITAFKLR